MKHIFVAIGQNHLNNFEKLIENGMLPEGPKILVAGSNVVCDLQFWDEKVVSKNSFDNKAGSPINQVFAISKKIKAYKALITQLEKYKNEPATVYVCYIEDILSNYLFFSFGKQTQAVVVEDGTLNYYGHSLKNIGKTKFALKQAISSFHGVPFKKYKGHSSGAEYPHVVSQYLTFPQKAFIRDKALQLPVKKTPVSNPLNSLFIIGQESSGQLIGQAKFESLMDGFFQKLRKQGFYNTLDKIYYKPHRNGVQFPKAYLKGSFPEKQVKVVKTPLTAEDFFFETASCNFLAALDSSALANIYSRLTDADKGKISFFVHPTNQELEMFFEKLGFVFLNETGNS